MTGGSARDWARHCAGAGPSRRRRHHQLRPRPRGSKGNRGRGLGVRRALSAAEGSSGRAGQNPGDVPASREGVWTPRHPDQQRRFRRTEVGPGPGDQALGLDPRYQHQSALAVRQGGGETDAQWRAHRQHHQPGVSTGAVQLPGCGSLQGGSRGADALSGCRTCATGNRGQRRRRRDCGHRRSEALFRTGRR